MRPVLYSTYTLSLIFIVLAQWNNCTRIHMSPYSDTLSWFRANQYLLFLLNDMCHTEATHSNVIVWFNPIRARTHDMSYSQCDSGVIQLFECTVDCCWFFLFFLFFFLLLFVCFCNIPSYCFIYHRIVLYTIVLFYIPSYCFI